MFESLKNITEDTKEMTRPRNTTSFDPLKPHFCTVKLGFTWDTLILLFLLKNIDFGYSLEPPRRGGSNKYL